MVYNTVLYMFIVFYTVLIVYVWYLWLVPHPVVLVTHRSMECIYVCMQTLLPAHSK